MNMITLSRYLSLLQPDCATWVKGQNPKTTREAAHKATEFDVAGFWTRTGTDMVATGGRIPQGRVHGTPPEAVSMVTTSSNNSQAGRRYPSSSSRAT